MSVDGRARLDWVVGQDECKRPVSVRSKSEPRNILVDLQDQTMLAEQKRDIVKKILRLQRQKFKDNQARKSRKSNEFEQSTHSFAQLNQFPKNNDDDDDLLDE